MKLKRWAHETARTCLLALAAGMSLTSHAAIVYSNGAPDQVYGTQAPQPISLDVFDTVGVDPNFANSHCQRLTTRHVSAEQRVEGMRCK